jgi:putative spermidine/putrescine transport system permease protein
VTAAAIPLEGGLTRRMSDIFVRRPSFLLLLLLVPPLLWLGIVYLGSLLALLMHSFYSIDEFSGFIVYEFTLSTYAELLRLSNLDVIIRSLVMSIAVTIGCAAMAFPISYYAARYARGNGRRCSISSSCCPCGRAIWSRSMPGS